MKKRTLTFLLALLLVFSVLCVPYAGAIEIRIMGDVDSNRKIDYNDALLTLRASIDLEILDAEAWECGDVDNSGELDYNDALLILRKSIQLLDTFPAEQLTVTFNANGEDVAELPAPIALVRGQYLEMPEAPVREGFTFEGWYLDANCRQAFDFQTPITDSITLYALWQAQEAPVPEETVPEEIVPEETVPEETVPEETVPEETVPEETVPAEPDVKVVDLTEKLDALMHKNAATMRSVLKKRGWYLAAIYFYEKVKDGGDWDIKLTDEWTFEEGTVYLYQGKEIRWDDPGNIHFGYVGAVVFSEEAICLGAGLNQITKFGFSFGDFSSYYDDPRDQEMMRWGHRLYKSGY